MGRGGYFALALTLPRVMLSGENGKTQKKWEYMLTKQNQLVLKELADLDRFWLIFRFFSPSAWSVVFVALFWISSIFVHLVW